MGLGFVCLVVKVCLILCLVFDVVVLVVVADWLTFDIDFDFGLCYVIVVCV